MLFCVQHFMNFRRLQIGSTSDKPTSAMDIRIADISAPCLPPLPEHDEPSPSPNLERTGLSVEFELLLEQLVNLHLSEVAQATQQTSQYFTAATRLILQFFCSWQPVLRCMWFFLCLNCFLRKQFFRKHVMSNSKIWKCAKKEIFRHFFGGGLWVSYAACFRLDLHQGPPGSFVQSKQLWHSWFERFTRQCNTRWKTIG